MRAYRRLSALVILCTLAACGSQTGPAATGETFGSSVVSGGETSAVSSFEYVDIENGELPDEWADRRAAAPWSADRVTESDAPGELVAAWRGAENRDWCAPLAPSGSLEGVRIRRADYSGGWAVEFDKNGMPGMTRSGQACTNCGRGAFGIAGTAVTVDEEEEMEAEERTLSDGSRVRYEPSVDEADLEEGAEGSVATLKIRGQDCVYQVWSFSGDAHLEELIEELRFVETDDSE